MYTVQRHVHTHYTSAAAVPVCGLPPDMHWAGVWYRIQYTTHTSNVYSLATSASVPGTHGQQGFYMFEYDL